MRVRLLTMEPVKFGNWMVKGSSTNLDSICILMRHIETGETKVRFFTDEIAANYFIESVLQTEE